MGGAWAVAGSRNSRTALSVPEDPRANPAGDAAEVVAAVGEALRSQDRSELGVEF